MPNGHGFEAYPTGPTPDPKMVGQMLQQKAAANAAGLAPEAAPDALGAASASIDDYAASMRGTPAEGPYAMTGGDESGTPGRMTPPPPSTTMPTQSASNFTTRPELQTVDDDFDPATEHSASGTAAALGDALRRVDGGVTGRGKVQNPSAASPLQRYQLERMGLPAAEIDFLTMSGAVKGPAGV